jgi:hypothetical protein
MSYLWSGVIAGVLLTYLAMRARRQRAAADFLWFSAAAVLMLFIPFMLEFLQMEALDESNLRKAMWTVQIPWFAGGGLGIWICLSMIPLRRLLRNLRLRTRGRVGPETEAMRQQYGQDVHYKIVHSQRHIFDIEERLLGQSAVHPKNEGLVTPSNLTAKASTEAWLSSTAEPGFNYARPYGTLLAAMLLHAADELDSAVRDIELLSTREELRPDDLTIRFKRAMLSTLQVSNIVAYFLSQKIEFADNTNLIRKMEGRGDDPAEMADARGAPDSTIDGAPIVATT